MPTSRNRRTRNRPSSAHQRRLAERRRAARQVAAVRATPRSTPSDELPSAYTESDWHLLRQGADAEAAGDAARALDLFRKAPGPEGSLREYMLREMAWLGDDAPAWAVARWVLRQVHRGLLLDKTPRSTQLVEQALTVTIGSAYADVDQHHPMGLEPRRFVTRILTEDWIFAQLATFEYGGLRDFLDNRASSLLSERAHGIDDWCRAPMGGYRLEAFDDDRLLVTDLADDRQHEVLHIGAAHGRDAGATVLGRIVPISAAPGAMFESRPVEVDERTAMEAASRVRDGESTGWLAAVDDGRASGRLPVGFSLQQPTSILCDLPAGPQYGLAEEPTDEPSLRARRCRLRSVREPEDVVAAVVLCDQLLEYAVTEDAAPLFAPQVTALLLDPRLFDAVRRHCARPGLEGAWLSYADCVAVPVLRARCRELAELSGHGRPVV